jgi:hypothetical protein
MGVKPGLILRIKYRLRLFDNRVPRKTFVPARKEVPRQW